MSDATQHPPTPSDADRLAAMLRAGHACVRIVTIEEDEARTVALQAAQALQRAPCTWSAVSGLVTGHIEGRGAVPETMRLGAACAWGVLNAPESVFVLLDACPALVGDHAAQRALRELVHACGARGGGVVLIDADEAATPPALKAGSTLFELALPDEETLGEIVKGVVRQMHRQAPVSTSLTRAEFSTIVRNLRGLSRRQAGVILREVVAEDRTLNIYDLNSILARKRRMLQSGGLLEYVKSPVDMDAIGGLPRLKAWLKARERAMDEDARAFGIEPPRGVLILGVQGAGKSLSAKAIATAWKRPLLRLDMGALYDKYVGQSERNLRDALHQAEVMAPNVLWMDEIEKAFAGSSGEGGGGGGGSDSGLSRRMLGMLLTWMQEHRSGVFLAATANDIDSLPPELMRKGRFDEIFFVDLPGPEAREAIFRIHLEKRKRPATGFDLARLVDASDGHSGAEIEQAVIAALLGAYADAKRELSTDDLVRALESSPPLSVTRAEKIAELREWARGRCVSAE
jgi:AAA+ superfamily predicted ATPase